MDTKLSSHNKPITCPLLGIQDGLENVRLHQLWDKVSSQNHLVCDRDKTFDSFTAKIERQGRFFPDIGEVTILIRGN